MSTRWSHARVVGVLASLSVLALAGCSAGSAGETEAAGLGCQLPEGAVAIVAAGRANAPVVDDTPAVVAAINHAIDTGTSMSIIDSGGQPAIVQQGSLESKANNEPARKDERRKFMQQVGEALQSVRSTAPEANPLDALGLAADFVRSRGATGTIVLADSGLQTTGALNYAESGMLTADPEELVQQVKGAGQLPDLSGMTVLLSGIGTTAAPQPSLDNATRARLQQHWQAIATAAGASCVYLDPQPNAQMAPTGVPAVSVVEPPPPPTYDLDQPIPLREDVLAFEDDSPKLLDPAAARASLEPLVEALQAAPGTIHLTGTTASGGTEKGRLKLSKQRAETVRDLLIDMGIPASRITTEGVGTNFPGYRNDVDAQGRQIPHIAAQNRSVIVEVR